MGLLEQASRTALIKWACLSSSRSSLAMSRLVSGRSLCEHARPFNFAPSQTWQGLEVVGYNSLQ